MEASVTAHPGTMFFSRPISLDGSLCPLLPEPELQSLRVIHGAKRLSKL